MELIEMVAYRAGHATDEHPWRCVKCDELTPVPDRWILVHLAGEHGLEAELLRTETDGIFLYPPTKKEVAQ